jgi:hypothetical protein
MKSSRRLTRSVRPSVEPLETRQLLNGAPADLHDPLIRPVADAEFNQNNGSLTRGDVIHLLDVVDGTEKALFTNGTVNFYKATPSPSAKVTVSQLTDLRTLVRNEDAWGMPDYVANLLDKVVNQNPANEHYQGADLLASGQLTAGTKDRVLQDLVGKWFYGADLPATADAVANNGIPDAVVYKTASGTLFGPNGPTSGDIAQGWVGDCYFMSSLGELATQSPQTVKDMFIDNHDGTYTVRFFQLDSDGDAWQPDYVTVNLELPVLQQSGQFAFAGWFQGGKSTTYADKNAVLWPALAEKAYAQLAEEGWSRANGAGGSGISGTPNDWYKNSYDALAFGDGVALQQLSGSNITYDVGLATATAADEAALAKAFAHGTMVTIGSLGQEPAGVPTNASGSPLIISGHVYALKSVNLAKDQFTLVNPYDDNGPYPGDGQRTVTLTWSQLKTYLNDAFEVAPPPIVPQHEVVQNGPNTGIDGHAKIVNVQWFDNGIPISGPKVAHEGDTITVTFDTLAGAPTTEFSLVAYAAPNGVLSSGNIDHQQEWADTTATYTGAGHHSLTVTLPNGYFQMDFVRGAAIADFATGARYSGEGRFIAGTLHGDHPVEGEWD